MRKTTFTSSIILPYHYLTFSVYTTLLILLIALLSTNSVLAINRVSVSSGSFNSPATWSPSGIPSPTDNVTIQNSHTISVDTNSDVSKLTIANGGKLIFSPSAKLTMNGDLLVYGIAEIIDGDIDFVTPGASFTIGATGSVTWSPANNTSTGATLFANGVEYFHPASTLIIKKWYNYSNVPLGSVVTGNFGNVTLNTLTNGLLYEWNQNNFFETHKVLGKLSIDQGWVVLDKSGTISNTVIGSISLNNINSYLDLHSGNHPGSFTVSTSSIKNIGGKLNGLYNGEGNIYVEVNGDVTNLGNIELIYNSGIQGIANGNASMKVTGLFYQTTGDFRGIFNISSTTSGKVDLEFENVKLTGGIFMGQYSCHTAGNNSTIQIKGNLEIDYTSANAKFRGNGLTTLSGIDNNLSMQLIIDGDLIVKGPLGAEFTSSGSTGPETTIIKGTSRYEGCTSNFNFGSHATVLTMMGDVTVSGGLVYFSRTNGSLLALLQEDLQIESGNLSVTGGSGNSNVIIHGDYNQTGGSLFFHNNNLTATPNIIYTTIHGNFTNNSGNITFDNNPNSTAPHHLSLNGEFISLSNGASVNTMITPSAPAYGIIYYDRVGTLQYSSTGTLPALRYIKQVINSGCTVKVTSGNFQSAESLLSSDNMVTVSSGSTLDLGENQLYSLSSNQNSSLLVDDNGRLRISHENGLYNGTSNAAINASGHMIYRLHEKSIVEYYGLKPQVVTGIGTGNATTISQQYGLLEINKSRKSASLNGSQVTLRSGIILTDGELHLNNFNLTLNSGEPTAISKSAGYIKSEGNASGTSGMVKWKNISPGTYIIPFGISSIKQIPFYFTPLSGFGGEFAVSTRSTSTDNRPLTNTVSNLNYNGTEAGINKIIDRWYHVSAANIKADITASYLPEENTTNSEISSKNFSFIRWNGSYWKLSGGTGAGTTTTTGTVSTNVMTTWGPLLLVSNVKLEAADILNFNAALVNGNVDLEWTSMANVTAVKYTVERSADEFQYEDVFDKSAQPVSNTASRYDGTDNNPLQGISFYRLKQFMPDGNIKYSQAVRIDNSQNSNNGLSVLSVNPNPFSDVFTIKFMLPADGDVELKLTSSSGQVTFKKFINGAQGHNSYEFTEGSTLTTGIYILTLSNGTTIKNYKLFHI